jgi:hypothetical protein
MRSDPRTRGAVKKAQIVLVGIGGADLNAGDTRLEAGGCKAEACYAADLRAFGRNLDTTAKDAVPPFITQKIGVYQTKTLKQYIRAAMAKHRGRCVDVLRAFNGRKGTENAYAKGWLTKAHCCYPSGKGQQLMAMLVFRTGLAPLR